MPTYVYKCDTCKEVWEESFPYEERNKSVGGTCEAINSCNGTIVRIPAMPGFAYDNIGSKKPDASFNDKLKEIKNAHHDSTLNIIE